MLRGDFILFQGRLRMTSSYSMKGGQGGYFDVLSRLPDRLKFRSVSRGHDRYTKDRENFKTRHFATQ